LDKADITKFTWKFKQTLEKWFWDVLVRYFALVLKVYVETISYRKI